MDITQIGTSLAIIVICYLIGLGAKTIPSIKDNLIPVIVGVSGGILVQLECMLCRSFRQVTL